jgi:hypothetical protein
MDFLKQLPVEVLFVFIACFGGVARYLNGYTNGVPFKFGIFLASGVSAGFSGWVFASFGSTMNLPLEMLFVMAGTGGFFGEQTMKYVLESVIKNKNPKQ